MSSGIVLVVDDLSLMVKLVEAVLEHSGFEVRGTDDPHQAIEAAAEYGDRVKLLITDMRMTRMNGREVAQQVERQCPGVAVIFMSGDGPEAFGFVADDRHAFLQKPFRNQSLLDCVARLGVV